MTQTSGIWHPNTSIQTGDSQPQTGGSWPTWLKVALIVGGAVVINLCGYFGLSFAVDQARSAARVELTELATKFNRAVQGHYIMRLDIGNQAATASDLAGAVFSATGTATPELADVAKQANELIAADRVPKRPNSAVLAWDSSILRPWWLSLFEIGQMVEFRRLFTERTSDVVAATEKVGNFKAPLADARAAVYASAAAAGQEVLDGNPEATVESRIALTAAVKQQGDEWIHEPNSDDGYRAMQKAAAAVVAAQRAYDEHTKSPSWQREKEIGEFARTHANGVPLDITFVEVTGLGTSSTEYYAGTAQTRTTDGGWSSIELTHSIAQNWEKIDAKAVVVHEVGHAQEARPLCRAIVVGPVFNSDHEIFATAWAIASGYDTLGAGIESYGRPSEEQIATARQCVAG